MANTYQLIASNVLSSSAASVTFSAIPSTYTDLVLRASARSTTTSLSAAPTITLNGSATTYSSTLIYATGTTVGSFRGGSTSWPFADALNGGGTTSNTFTSIEFYIPNYAGSTSKVASSIAAMENNSTTDYEIAGQANLWSTSSAITSIGIAVPTFAFASGSSFYLYGIKNA